MGAVEVITAFAIFALICALISVYYSDKAARYAKLVVAQADECDLSWLPKPTIEQGKFIINSVVVAPIGNGRDAFLYEVDCRSKYPDLIEMGHGDGDSLGIIVVPQMHDDGSMRSITLDDDAAGHTTIETHLSGDEWEMTTDVGRYLIRLLFTRRIHPGDEFHFLWKNHSIPTF